MCLRAYSEGRNGRLLSPGKQGFFAFFFDFPFTQATGLSLRGPSARQHLMLFGGGEQKHTSEHLVAMLEGGSRLPPAPPRSLLPESYVPQLILRCEFLPLCDFIFLTMISLMPGLVLKGTLCAMVVCDCLLTINLLCSLEQVT